MHDEFKYSLLMSGIRIANLLSAESPHFSWSEVASELFKSFRGTVSSLSIYTADISEENLEEVAVADGDGAIEGMDLIPFYLLPDEVTADLKVAQLDLGGSYRIMFPLSYAGKFIGLIELRAEEYLSSEMQEAISEMANAFSMGLYLKMQKDFNIKNKMIFEAVIHIGRAIQACSNLDELMSEFTKLTIDFLKFDRVSIFVIDPEDDEMIYNISTNSKGETLSLKKAPDIPIDLVEPKPLEDLSGYWIPMRLQDRNIGVVLVDNIYTLCDIPKSSITILAELCGQLALSIEHQKLLDSIKNYARYDELTGTYNRRTSIEAIERQMHLSKEEMQSFTLCYIDVDGLKKVNDSFGHVIGDDLLKSFISILREKVRQNDIIGRLGGDEFLLVLPRCDIFCAERIWSRIQEGMHQFNRQMNMPYTIRASHGVAQFNPEDNFSATQLIMLADIVMYEEKSRKLNIQSS